MADITMPQLGETVTEGTITKWFKKVGEQVAVDEPLFEVSTDKVDSEVPSSAAGFVAEILVDEGQTVDVGTKLAVISQDQPSGGDGAAPQAGPPQAQAAPDDRPAPEDEPEPEDADVRPSRAVAEAPTEQGAEAPPPPEEQQPEPEPAPPPAPQQSRQPAAPSASTSGKLLSPVVRRLINEHGLDPDQIRPSWPVPRI